LPGLSRQSTSQGAANMSDKAVVFDAEVRVRQFYRAYLDSIYGIDYYRLMNKKVTDYSKHLDFVIALGAALGGGSGLGILASPWMALPCGIITSASVVVSAAKQAYNWPEKSKFCSEMMHRYSLTNGQCKRLFEDLQAIRVWNTNFEESFLEIRKTLSEFPVDEIPELDISIRRKIQNEVVVREAPQNWWKPPPAQSSDAPRLSQ
jgi:hypothetical protein